MKGGGGGVKILEKMATWFVHDPYRSLTKKNRFWNLFRPKRKLRILVTISISRNGKKPFGLFENEATGLGNFGKQTKLKNSRSLLIKKIKLL